MYESDKEYIFTEEQLIGLCREWQERLRLEYWDVALKVARVQEFKLKEAQGECTWTLETACAIIRIVDPLDYPKTPFKQDMEATLVHELLHLHFAHFDNTAKGSLDEMMMERSIEHIARALVKLKRENQAANSHEVA